MPNSPEFFTHDQIALLLDECVAEILAHENSDRFLAWFRLQAPRLLGHMPVEPAALPPLAAALGRNKLNPLGRLIGRDALPPDGIGVADAAPGSIGNATGPAEATVDRADIRALGTRMLGVRRGTVSLWALRSRRAPPQ